jgi:hypothetical protein
VRFIFVCAERQKEAAAKKIKLKRFFIAALSLARFEKVVALIFCRIRNREIRQIRENRIKQNSFAYFAWFAVHRFHFEKSVFHPCSIHG